MTKNNLILKFSAIVIILINFIHNCNGFYEDQVGKFDWRQNYIGKINYGFFDVTGPDKIIVSTEENTIAAINTKSGALLWRRILEDSTRGDIKFCYINSDPKSIQSTSQSNNVIDVITVSGYNPALIRGWNTNTGNLEWEWTLMPINPEKDEQALWFLNDSYLYHIIPVWNSHIEITEYIAVTGKQRVTKTSRIDAKWISEDKCILSQNYFVCSVGNKLMTIDLLSKNADVITRTFEDEILKKPTLVKGLNGLINIGSKIISVKDPNVSIAIKSQSSIFSYKANDENVIIQSYVEHGKLHISASVLGTGANYNDISSSTPYSDSFGAPSIMDIKCRRNPNSENGNSCRILLSSEDGAIILLQQGKIKWVKEEALARVVAVEFIDLTLSDAEGAIEEELNNKNGDVLGAMIRRFTSQYSQLKNLVLHVLGLGAPPSATQRAGLVRDDFGLHKMIVVVTASGKLFGIDNVSGKQHWIKYLPNFEGFNKEANMKLLIQRTSKYYPLPAQCAVIGKNKLTGKGVIYQFSPISGQPLGGGLIELDYQFKQVVLLQNTGSDHLKAIMALDSNNNVHVTPKGSETYANGLYIYTADKSTGSLSGYFVEYEHAKLRAIPTWKVNLGGPSNTQKIIEVAVKNPIEHVHSQGRVLADRSVLYKYINPNLIAVATHGPDTIHKYILNIHLIDVVSGNIVFSMTHRRVKPPLHMVHSENWLVYSYYNDKVRRTEITSVELYEGKTQANSTVWSSLEAPPQPMVERQSYIIPANVAALKETITEKGITNKHVLIGLSSGNIVEMSWAFLDPRRPVTSPEKAREEGIIPYIPELPLPHESVINYNQSIARISGIHTSPSGLESTCLVFIYGLDIFVTRVAPSKTFDLLKEDFDYFLISVVLIALTTASYVVKHLSSRKALKQAWK